MKTDEQLLNLSKWKYLLLIIFTASVTIILKENLKLRNFNEVFDKKESYSQNIGRDWKFFIFTFFIKINIFILFKSYKFIFNLVLLNFPFFFYYKKI